MPAKLVHWLLLLCVYWFNVVSDFIFKLFQAPDIIFPNTNGHIQYEETFHYSQLNIFPEINKLRLASN